MMAPFGEMNFCKSILSAAITGFPMATLAGWEERLNDEERVGVPTMNRIAQIHDYLGNKDDNDLVIVVDGVTSVSSNLRNFIF